MSFKTAAQYPELRENQRNAESKATELWVRLNAFLDLKAPNTQRTYVGIINEWCEFLGVTAGTEKAATALLKANDLHALAYRNWLVEQPGQTPRLQTSALKNKLPSIEQNLAGKTKRRDGTQSSLSNATIAKKLTALRRIYRMFIGTGLGITANPFDTDKIPPPSARSGQKRPTEMIDFKKVKEVLELPDSTTPKGLRDLAVLAVLFGGGLRRSEVVNLRIGDVGRTSQGTTFLYLRATKAQRDARQALPDWAASPVHALVAWRGENGAANGDFLFVSFRGPGGQIETSHPLSDNGLYRLFKRYCERVDLGDFVSPHSARATAITKLLHDGKNHREVQEFSRHSSVQMVEVYDKRRIDVEESAGKELSFDE